MKLTKKAIIDETAEAYSDPRKRAYDAVKHKCLYLDDAGNKCAVGRCLAYPNEWRSLIGSVNHIMYEQYQVAANQTTKECPALDQQIKPQYQGHSIDFWTSIQNWHDCPDNFDITNKRISVQGHMTLSNMHSQWDDKSPNVSRGGN